MKNSSWAEEGQVYTKRGSVGGTVPGTGIWGLLRVDASTVADL
jgi:hypothetical protein